MALIVSPVFILGLLVKLEYSFLYIVLVGLFALSKVLYYSLTFNNCTKAAEELKKEIKEARIDLTKKGFNFVIQ